MRLRPLHRLFVWSARWLSPSFVWPELRHEAHARRRYVRQVPLPTDLCGGIVTSDLRTWPAFVTGDGTLDDIEDAR